MTLDLDPERKLALAYVPAAQRTAVDALWRLDVELGAVLATGRDPMISRIRLAWWRESLEKLDRERPPSEPVLETVAANVLSIGVTGAELAEMEQGWRALLDPGPLTPDILASHAEHRGALLFRYSARLLAGDAGEVADAGKAWALVDLARRSTDEAEVDMALEAARSLSMRAHWPVRLRPLGMLARLAMRDARSAERGLERQGAPGRILLMLRHRLTGH